VADNPIAQWAMKTSAVPARLIAGRIAVQHMGPAGDGMSAGSWLRLGFFRTFVVPSRPGPQRASPGHRERRALAAKRPCLM